jgi:bacteriocin biosynthesis cyclodehydratase domain-containing protein
MKTAILTEGRFGAAVADRLARDVKDLIAAPLGMTVRDGELDALVARVDFVAVAVWRPYHAYCDAVDDACARLGKPWTLSSLESRFLKLGPTVVPRYSACHRCFRRRVKTHHEAPEREIALAEAYDNDPRLGANGFLDSMVTMSAAFIATTRRTPSSTAGRLRRIDLVDLTLDDLHVVRVHGCSRCGHLTPEQSRDRFTAHLVPAVERILK